MPNRTLLRLVLASFVAPLLAQSPSLTSVAPIAFDNSSPVLAAHTESLKPFTVAGQHGVLVGQQDGVFESWILPVKLLSHLTLEANVAGYGVPIDVNAQSAEIEVRSDRTILTYSHPAFTVRQIMFSPDAAQIGPAKTGPIVLYEFDCLHPTEFTFRFTPELRWMWPERNEGTPGVEWVSANPNASAASGSPSSGWYVLHTDYPDLAAAIAIPGATHGILAPYQERPQVHPVELILQIDPVRDQKKLFPLLMAAGISTPTATNAALGATLAQLNAQIPALYQAHSASWKKLLAAATSIDTPDQALNAAFQWAVISIEQLKTKTIPGQSSPPPSHADPASAASTEKMAGDPPETALVAGYFTSADSARPGFGWFFGRDALYTLYAVNGYGDYALTRSELEFLIHRQRADGKIMHEYSQTAAAIDWQSFPYMYAAADSTPLFLLAVADYVRAAGDTAFLTTHRDAIEKAWAFETDPAHDTDHDGIYDNSQGTGWVESWPGAMPHQEIYLALLDQQASSAMAFLETLLNDSAKASAARDRAAAIARTINSEYSLAEHPPSARDSTSTKDSGRHSPSAQDSTSTKGSDQHPPSAQDCYAFATNPPGTSNSPVDRTATVYPALAWWDPAAGQPLLQRGDSCLRQFAGAALNTDWGLRDVANTEKIYDGLSYHQGSVWPLFTGWAALAEYRGNQPLAGYQLLMENANLTWAQDLGSDTELLSGDFFVPFGRSTSHQLWSSAMVITPALRGLFGIAIDAQSKTITVNPHLPGPWDHAAINHLALPGGDESLTFDRNGAVLEVALTDAHHTGFRLRSDLPGATSAEVGSGSAGLRIPLAPLALFAPFHAPLPGARTESPRVISESWEPTRATLLVEGQAGSTATFTILRRSLLPHLKADTPQDRNVDSADTAHRAIFISSTDDSAQTDPGVPLELTIHFPPGSGFQTLPITLTW
jgi:glycogen debranching enzyme